MYMPQSKPIVIYRLTVESQSNLHRKEVYIQKQKRLFQENSSEYVLSSLHFNMENVYEQVKHLR